MCIMIRWESGAPRSPATLQKVLQVATVSDSCVRLGLWLAGSCILKIILVKIKERKKEHKNADLNKNIRSTE